MTAAVAPSAERAATARVPVPSVYPALPWSVADLDRLVAAVIRRGGSEATRRAYRLDLAQFFAWLHA